MRWSADGLVAVTGASGRLGSRLAYRLAAEGAHQRLLTRTPDRIPRLADGSPLPQCETMAIPGYQDGAALVAALQGVHALFMVSARADPARLTAHRTVLEAAAAAGVQRVVYTSSTLATAGPEVPGAVDHRETERVLASLGLSRTVLRVTVYHRELTVSVVDDMLPAVAAAARVASVSHDDVADVATAVLLDERPARHDGVTYTLTGPRSPDLDEVAAVLSQAAGRPITCTGPEPAAPTIRDLVTALVDGVFDVVTDDVGRLVGRPARSLEQWLDDYPREWSHLR